MGEARGQYAKTTWNVKSADGPCTECTKCFREYGGARSMCCDVLVDADGNDQVGDCGKDAEAPDFEGKQCLCGGLLILKAKLHASNPSCQPSTSCYECGPWQGKQCAER